MKGIINKIWLNKTKDGKKYWVLNIGGENYSVWNKKYIQGIEEGATVDYEWTQSGDFKKVTEMKRIDIDRTLDPEENGNSKDNQIVRMSCIKSATALVSNFDVSPDEKGEITLGLARKFEEYVTNRKKEKEASEIDT